MQLSNLPTVGADEGTWGDELNGALVELQDGITAVEDRVTTLEALPPGGGGAVASVNGKTGIVTITATDLSLGNVNNTADSVKPVSVDQQAAIDAAKDRSNHTGTQPSSTINDFVPAAQLAIPKAVVQNADGSWPARTTSGTTDRTVRVTFVGTLPGPTIGTNAADAQVGVDRLEVTAEIPT